MVEQTWKEEQRLWKLVLWEGQISQTKFADKYKFNRAQLSQWLNGKQKIGRINRARLLEALLNTRAPTNKIEGVLGDD